MTLKVSIFGGGFGIYGYLPAASSLGWEVATLARYEQSIRERPELTAYSRDIQFFESELELIKHGSAVIFARTPASQLEFLNTNLNDLKNTSHIFLEKPLTTSASNSLALLDTLNSNHISFSLGYLFPFTDWFNDLEGICSGEGNRIIINWAIPISSSSWKNDENSGGGIVNAFLIHFVPVFTKLGFSLANFEIQSKKGSISLNLQNDNFIEINAKQVSENFEFEIWANKNLSPVFRAQTPFGLKPIKGILDPRKNVLEKYLAGVIKASDNAAFSNQTELNVINFLKLFSAHMETQIS